MLRPDVSLLLAVSLLLTGACATTNLARRPVQPGDMDRQLAGNYPLDELGVSRAGRALLKATVLANGNVKILKTLSESSPGYGEGCRRTLAESVWQPAHGKNGKAADATVRYKCEFEDRSGSTQIQSVDEEGPPKRLMVMTAGAAGWIGAEAVRRGLGKLGEAWVQCVMASGPPSRAALHRLNIRVDKTGRVTESNWLAPNPPPFDHCVRDLLSRMQLPSAPGPTAAQLVLALVESRYPPCNPFEWANRLIIGDLRSRPRQRCLEFELSVDP